MRSWIFVIGAAAMGVASVLGFFVAIARAQQRVEIVAQTPGREMDARLPDTTWLLRFNVRAAAPSSRCASCHRAENPAAPLPHAQVW